MLGRNLSGRPDNKDYLLGRACVFVSELDAVTGLPTCYRPVGNTPNLSLSVDVEELTHRASLCAQFGGAVVDRRLIIQQTLNISMTLEEINHENAAIFVSGTVDNPANPAVAGITAFTLTTELALNCWYPIFDSAGIRAMGIDKTLVVSNNITGAPVLLIQGAAPTGDYTVDEVSGMVEYHSGGPDATLAAGSDIDIALTADAGAPATIERVLALTAAQKRFAVKAMVENANNAAEIVEVEFHSVNLVGDGDLAMVGDELAQMGLSGVAEANTALAGSPTLTISKAL